MTRTTALHLFQGTLVLFVGWDALACSFGSDAGIAAIEVVLSLVAIFALSFALYAQLMRPQVLLAARDDDLWRYLTAAEDG